MKRALITGASGQDGRLLAKFLTSKGGYEVHGLVRRRSNMMDESGMTLHEGDICFGPLAEVIKSVEPDEVYHFAAQSNVAASWTRAIETSETIVVGSLRLLECVRNFRPSARVYMASSSEVFGRAAAPQDETSALLPTNPYGCAKACALMQTVNYRESYSMFLVNGIAYGHESELRPENFVTRKISKAVAEISTGRTDKLVLGDLSARRDWGWAEDYVEAMWASLQLGEPRDYVLATGELHSVGEFAEAAFTEVGLDWREYVESSTVITRPLDGTRCLVGNPARAREYLEWSARTKFPELVRRMVRADLAKLKSRP